jgi:hypothetical protein
LALKAKGNHVGGRKFGFDTGALHDAENKEGKREEEAE